MVGFYAAMKYFQSLDNDNNKKFSRCKLTNRQKRNKRKIPF